MLLTSAFEAAFAIRPQVLATLLHVLGGRAMFGTRASFQPREMSGTYRGLGGGTVRPLDEMHPGRSFYHMTNFTRLQGEGSIFKLLLHLALPEEASVGPTS
jgi:hypothetical protein